MRCDFNLHLWFSGRCLTMNKRKRKIETIIVRSSIKWAAKPPVNKKAYTFVYAHSLNSQKRQSFFFFFFECNEKEKFEYAAKSWAFNPAVAILLCCVLLDFLPPYFRFRCFLFHCVIWKQTGLCANEKIVQVS